MLTEVAHCPTSRVECVGEDEQGVMGRVGRVGEMWRTNGGSVARFYVILCEHILSEPVP